MKNALKVLVITVITYLIMSHLGIYAGMIAWFLLIYICKSDH